jgi:hypothetical protein
MFEKSKKPSVSSDRRNRSTLFIVQKEGRLEE